MFDRLFTAARRNDTRRQLNALSDSQLRDIGLRREQIDDVAAELDRHPAPASVRNGLAMRGLDLMPLLRAYRSA